MKKLRLFSICVTLPAVMPSVVVSFVFSFIGSWGTYLVTAVIDGDKMDAYPAEKRPVSMVFQKALLLRNMNVEKMSTFRRE